MEREKLVQIGIDKLIEIGRARGWSPEEASASAENYRGPLEAVAAMIAAAAPPRDVRDPRSRSGG